VVPSNLALSNLETALLKQPPVTLNPARRGTVEATVRQVCMFNKWVLHAVHARTEHVHMVVSALKTPELVMNSLKSWCTRMMREKGEYTGRHSPWSRHGSTRYLWNEQQVCEACTYVLHGQGSPLPDGRGTA
jgi:REP element-mobilizing transposase RayT